MIGLCWGGAAKRLKERDNHIGWDAVTCAKRLKLIVQLRRFYVIDSARRPNLASQCLALSLRTLGGEFQARHGFQPLLAESFHDPEEHTGTLYKATNWQLEGALVTGDALNTQKKRHSSSPAMVATIC